MMPRTIERLEGEKRHYHWTYTETHDYLKIATAVGPRKAEAHRVHGRLQSKGT
jgi:hypothetical protein